MNNLSALSKLCTSIINTFYPDKGPLELALKDHGLDPEAEAQPKDPERFRAALALVMGYVESSRQENGVSTSVRGEEAIKRALRFWCKEYGLDPDEELSDTLITLDSITDRW